MNEPKDQGPTESNLVSSELLLLYWVIQERMARSLTDGMLRGLEPAANELPQ
jgi:hypothetical protein